MPAPSHTAARSKPLGHLLHHPTTAVTLPALLPTTLGRSLPHRFPPVVAAQPPPPPTLLLPPPSQPPPAATSLIPPPRRSPLGHQCRRLRMAITFACSTVASIRQPDAHRLRPTTASSLVRRHL
ncbi:hypothetical protein GUJ93_ZPchr0009g764 [Zizania palustris]|uniref:Uncharacterized protein n=1 Tax=Zizania palustris TaxID=103762 RepID=A0A8J5S686_ZIZPA|nr:hypothetical protein GUJ93_ZPchr0009g764 [Zizania palustris]